MQRTRNLAVGLMHDGCSDMGVWLDPRSLQRYQHVRPDAIPGRDAGALLESAEKKKAVG